MCETKFIIFTSLQSLNLLFPLLFHVISTAILKFPPWSLHRHPDSPHLLHFHPDSRIPMLILRIRIPIPFLAFLPLSAFSSFRSPVPDFGFYR